MTNLVESPKPTADLSHFRYVDALRGIAFLGVLMTHATQHVPVFSGQRLAVAGEFGVQLFFLMSAVTLFRSLSVRGRKEQHPTRNYFIRRFFRIAPMFWLAIFFDFSVYGTGSHQWAPAGLQPWHYLVTATFTHGWAPTSINSVVPGGWSIAAEMTFYLCLPILFRYVTGAWSALVAAFLLLVAGVLLTQTAADFLLPGAVPRRDAPVILMFLKYWFPRQACVFLLGAMLYYILQRQELKDFLSANSIRPLFLLALSGYAGFALSQGGGNLYIPPHVLFTLAFIPLVLALWARPFVLLVNPLICGLGKISFSCYIVHFAALTVVDDSLIETTGKWFLSLPYFGPEALFAVTVLSALALTVIVSMVTYRVIELPGIALGKVLIRRGEARPEPAGGVETVQVPA